MTTGGACMQVSPRRKARLAQATGASEHLVVCLKCFTCLEHRDSTSQAAKHAEKSGHGVALRLLDGEVLNLETGATLPELRSHAVVQEVKRIAHPSTAAAAAPSTAAAQTAAAPAPAADMSDAALAALLAQEGGVAVLPLTEYEGAHKHLGPLPESGEFLKAPTCSECGHAEVWVCLGCWAVLCSRYANGHAAEHAAASGHDIALSLMDMSVWSFSKDAYLDVFNILALHDAFRFAYLAKFDEEPALPVLQLTAGP